MPVQLCSLEEHFLISISNITLSNIDHESYYSPLLSRTVPQRIALIWICMYIYHAETNKKKKMKKTLIGMCPSSLTSQWYAYERQDAGFHRYFFSFVCVCVFTPLLVYFFHFLKSEYTAEKKERKKKRIRNESAGYIFVASLLLYHDVECERACVHACVVVNCMWLCVLGRRPMRIHCDATATTMMEQKEKKKKKTHTRHKRQTHS